MLFNKKKEESPIKADEKAKTAEDEEKKAKQKKTTDQISLAWVVCSDETWEIL